MHAQLLIADAVNHLGTVQAVAEHLRVSPQLLADVRSGRRNLRPYLAAQLAQLTGADCRRSILMALADGATSAEERAYWQVLAGP